MVFRIRLRCWKVIRFVMPLALVAYFDLHAADTAPLATWILFGVTTLVGFGEKRCRKNLPSYVVS